MNKKDSKVIKTLNDLGLNKDEKGMRDKEQSPSRDNQQSNGFVELVKKQKT